MQIAVISPCPDATITELQIHSWPIWSCGVSSFPWSYDEIETCLLLEGRVTVTPEGGDPVAFGAGDLVTFPAGLACIWKVHCRCASTIASVDQVAAAGSISRHPLERHPAPEPRSPGSS